MMPPDQRSELVEFFYFNPSTSISRVVFVGTPHRGTPAARRCIGKLASRLVEEPSALKEKHQQLINNNPNTFSREFSKRIPTSIDMLEPKSRLLLATDKLCLDPHVKLHSIYGYGYHMLGARDSDKVVPVWSAKLPGVSSEKAIHAKHTELHKHDEGINELLCILRKHAQAFDAAEGYLSNSVAVPMAISATPDDGFYQEVLPLSESPALTAPSVIAPLSAAPSVEVHLGDLE
jgi:hypothetical protein